MIFLILVIKVLTSILSNDYYIDSKGSDLNPCSKEKVCKTLSRVLELVDPNNICHIYILSLSLVVKKDIIFPLVSKEKYDGNLSISGDVAKPILRFESPFLSRESYHVSFKGFTITGPVPSEDVNRFSSTFGPLITLRKGIFIDVTFRNMTYQSLSIPEYFNTTFPETILCNNTELFVFPKNYSKSTMKVKFTSSNFIGGGFENCVIGGKKGMYISFQKTVFDGVQTPVLWGPYGNIKFENSFIRNLHTETKKGSIFTLQHDLKMDIIGTSFHSLSTTDTKKGKVFLLNTLSKLSFESSSFWDLENTGYLWDCQSGHVDVDDATTFHPYVENILCNNCSVNEDTCERWLAKHEKPMYYWLIWLIPFICLILCFYACCIVVILVEATFKIFKFLKKRKEDGYVQL